MLPFAVFVQCRIARCDHSADLTADMSSKFDDFGPEFLEVVVDIGDLLLLFEVGGLEFTETAVDLDLEVGLELLDVLDDGLLFAVEVRDGLLVLALDELDDVLGVADHAVVLVVELLHAEDVVGAGLLGQLERLLHLLVRALLEQKELLLHALDLLLQLPYRFLVRREIKLGRRLLPEGPLYHLLLQGCQLSYEGMLGLLDGFFLQGQFAVECLDQVDLVAKGVLDLQTLLRLDFHFTVHQVDALHALVVSLLQNFHSAHQLGEGTATLSRVKSFDEFLFDHGSEIIPELSLVA